MDRLEEIRKLRRLHQVRSVASVGGRYPITGPWSFRETCEHHGVWQGVGEHWEQCRTCSWCRPKLGAPPDVSKLPAILEGRVLPPLSGKVDLHALYATAGFVIDADRESVLSVVRVRVVQYTWTQHPLIRRCGAEVRFKGHGWREAAVFMETWIHRLVKVLTEAEPRRPRALWSSLNAAMECRWSPPWVREGWR